MVRAIAAGVLTYLTALFSQAWNLRRRSLSNDSLTAAAAISATVTDARDLRHCVSASRKAFAIAHCCLHAPGPAAHGPRCRISVHRNASSDPSMAKVMSSKVILAAGLARR